MVIKTNDRAIIISQSNNCWFCKRYSKLIPQILLKTSSTSVTQNWFHKCYSVVSDLRLETKGSRFESGFWLCAEVSSLH